jgi:hypothetical protein
MAIIVIGPDGEVESESSDSVETTSPDCWDEVVPLPQLQLVICEP